MMILETFYSSKNGDFQKGILTFLKRIVAEGDLDSLRFIYYGGIKNLNEYTNIDDRTIGHIVKI